MFNLKFKQWLEWGSPFDIRGEYWHNGDTLEYADGDIGDFNHEGIAIQHVLSNYAEEIAELSEELGVEDNAEDLMTYGEVDFERIPEVLSSISEVLQEKGMSEEQADSYIMKEIGCDQEAYLILLGFGHPRLYAMKNLGWVAIRSNNVELFGYDQQKQKQIADALNEIMDIEHGGQDVNPQKIEVSIYDHKTNKGWYSTLEELEQQQVGFKMNQPITSTYNKQFFTKMGDEENKYSDPQKSKINPWNTAAKNTGIGTDLWRGTSESTFR